MKVSRNKYIADSPWRLVQRPKEATDCFEVTECCSCLRACGMPAVTTMKECVVLGRVLLFSLCGSRRTFGSRIRNEEEEEVEDFEDDN